MGSQIGALFSGLWGDAGQNFVDLQGGEDAVFGTKPKVAPFEEIDLSSETTKALAANIENLPAITALLDKVIPGFSDLLATGTSNALSELKGELPPDVAAYIQRTSAFGSLMGGYSGTPMSKARTARDLGRTSLDLTTMGNNSAQIWTNLAEQAYSPFTISTGQQVSTTAANNAGIQANKQFQFNVDAAPDPGAAGVFGLDKELGMQMLSFGMGAGAGAIAGGGSGAASQYAQYAQYLPQQTSSNTMAGTGGYTYDASIGQYVPATSGGDWRSNATWGGG